MKRPSLSLTACSVCAALSVLTVAAPALGQTAGETAAPAAAAPPGEPPYDSRLLRLAEILGSVQYLRSLCNAAGDTVWRDMMSGLLDRETATEPRRRERLTAGYNRGYRAFAAVHTDCSPSAVAAEERYRTEGAALAAEIVARFGN